MGKCLTFYLRKEIIQLCLFAVENSNDNEDVEDDKISPELEELLMKKEDMTVHFAILQCTATVVINYYMTLVVV